MQLRTAKHVDVINMAGKEQAFDSYARTVEKVLGKCNIHKREFTNAGVTHRKLPNGDVTFDQYAYIATVPPIVSNELTGQPAGAQATKRVSDAFASLRGALAYTAFTKAWILVYIVALQRVQNSKNLDVRRLIAVTRKFQRETKTLDYPAMRGPGKVDIHSDSGYRRLTGGTEDDIKGYGMRGMNLILRGQDLKGQP